MNTKEIEENGFKYIYEDKEIPYIGETIAICLGVIESNKQYSKDRYISPIVTNVQNCTSCRKIISTNNPNIKL